MYNRINTMKLASILAMGQLAASFAAPSTAWTAEKLKDIDESVIFTKKASASDTAANLSAVALDLTLAYQIRKLGEQNVKSYHLVGELGADGRVVYVPSKSIYHAHPKYFVAMGFALTEGGLRLREASKGRDPGASPVVTMLGAMYDCKRPRPAIEITPLEEKKCAEAMGLKPNVLETGASSGR